MVIRRGAYHTNLHSMLYASTGDWQVILSAAELPVNKWYVHSGVQIAMRFNNDQNFPINFGTLTPNN